MSATLLAAIVLGFGLAVFLLHRLAWVAVRRLAAISLRLAPRLGPWLDRTRSRPFFERSAARNPRLHAALLGRLSPSAFTGLPLTLVAVVALLMLAMLTLIAHEVLEADGIVAFDNGINAFFGPYRDKVLLAIFLWLTDLGAGPAITAVAITATGFLWVAGRSRPILSLWITLLGAEATSWSAKYIIGRARPVFIDVVSASSPSFPSGHSTASMAVYGFVAYAVARHRPSLRTRFEIGFWAAMLIFLIGFSRVFLSVHFLSDVVSGFLVGSFWLLVGVAVAESARPPEVVSPN